MTPEQLKTSIFQYAIQGKLVEQRQEEGTAEDLYQQIQDEKLKLIKEGTIKKEKPLAEINEDEILFDIPDNWKWCRLGEIFSLTMGQSPDGKSVTKSSNGMEFHQGKVFFGENYIQKSDQVTSEPTKIAEPNSVLLCVRAPVGIVNITDRELCIGRGLCAIKPLANMTERFTLYLLRCFKDSFIRQATGTTFVAITGEVVKNQPIPLPPLEEQNRIVAKIEELLPYVDRYAEAYEKLEQFNAKFPEDMKKSILQYAIQGKLVEQRTEEGTAEELYQQIQDEKQKLINEGKIKKEKPLDEIVEGETPFDVPESWKWVRIGKIVYSLTAGGDKPSDFSETKDDKHPVPVVANGVTNDGIIGYTSEARAKAGTITIAGRGTIGFSLLRDYDYCPVVRLIVVDIPPMICPEYLQYVIQALPEKSVGTSIPQLTVPMLLPKVIPLPPLEEQKRIVAKIEELLPFCERLVK